MQRYRTISHLDCDVLQKVYFKQWPATASSVAGLRRISKVLLKVKLAPKQGHGHSLVVCYPSDPPQLSESQWHHYIWELCSANQWDALKITMPAAGTGQQKGPDSSPWQCLITHCTTSASEVELIGLWWWRLLIHCTHPSSHQPTTSSSRVSTFCRQNTSTTNRREKMLSKSSLNPKAWIFFATGINKLISHWQKCVGCNGSYFD